MKTNFLLTLAATLVGSVFATEVRAEPAAAVYARAQQQWRAGELEAAIASYAEAAEAEPANAEYRARFAHVQKATTLTQRLETEQNAARWVGIARALHTFYHQERLFEPALAIDRRLHQRLQSALSATLLAQTLTAMDRPQEAADTLQTIPEDARNLGTQTTLVIALVRAGKSEEAANVAKAMDIPDQLCAGKAYMLAHMKAALGDDPAAADLLSRAFDAVPAGRLPAFKATALQCPELAALLAKEPYRKLLDVQPCLAERSGHGHDGHSDHDHEDHAEGHCATCPLQQRVEDIPSQPAAGKP